MYALSQNSLAQSRPASIGAWKLAVCASLSLAITLLSARLINHSVVQADSQAAQPAVQLVVPVTPGSPTRATSATPWNRV